MTKERPLLKNLIRENMSEFELFQNTTIRPIIKMQHDVLIVLFEGYLDKRRIDFTNISDDKKKKKIEAILQKDIQFRNLVLGSILGHFSINELSYYQTMQSEINKRIVKIITQRIQDTL